MSSCWSEKLSLTDLDDDKSMLMTQLRATKWSSKMQFYRKVSRACSIYCLLNGMKSNILVWLDDDSFIVTKKLPKSVPYFSKFRKATTSIAFTRKTVYVYGISDHIVAVATARLLLLEDGASTVSIGNDYSPSVDSLVPTTFIRPRFLQKYVDKNPHRQLVLGRGCYLSQTQSITLASHPGPLNVGIECMFEDYGRKFVETLAQRTTDFGVLSLQKRSSFDSLYAQYSSSFSFPSQVMSGISAISLQTTSQIWQGSECLVPLASSARRVEYEIWNESAFAEIDSLTVVPKAVTLVFVDAIPSRLHTLFLQESGTVQELGLVYSGAHPPSAAQQKELCDALATNQNLQRLELGSLFVLMDFWSELLEVLGNHESLRSVKFRVRSEPDPDQMESLITFMKTHSRVDISFDYREVCGCIASANETMIEPVRLQNRIDSLARAPVHDRPSLFGAALTEWAGDDFYRTSRLLNGNVDLLCSLVGNPASSTGNGRPVKTSRPSDLLSLPNSKKQKENAKVNL